ncbi:MAG: hypothetical protein ACK5LR_11495 [Mangrovibacterium sp.]
MKDIERLKKSAGKGGFKIPQTYLDTFDERLEMRIDAFGAERKKTTKVIQFFRPMLALAACLVLAVLLFDFSEQQLTNSYADARDEKDEGMIELVASAYLADAYLADLLMQEEVEQSANDAEAMLSELSYYMSDLDLIAGMIVE